MSAVKSYFYNGAYTSDELDWPDEMELEEVLSTWGYETEACLNFGEELSFGVKVYQSESEWTDQTSYLVRLNLGDGLELIEVDALPNLLKLLEQVVPLAGASVAPTSETSTTSAPPSTRAKLKTSAKTTKS